MNDSISRAAAIRALGNEPEVWTEYDDYALGRNNQWHYDVSVIKTVPAIQPKRGRWKGEGLGDYRCSLCGEVNTRTRTNYCPNCGADMRGDRD